MNFLLVNNNYILKNGTCKGTYFPLKSPSKSVLIFKKKSRKITLENHIHDNQPHTKNQANHHQKHREKWVKCPLLHGVHKHGGR